MSASVQSPGALSVLCHMLGHWSLYTVWCIWPDFFLPSQCLPCLYCCYAVVDSINVIIAGDSVDLSFLRNCSPGVCCVQGEAECSSWLWPVPVSMAPVPQSSPRAHEMGSCSLGLAAQR